MATLVKCPLCGYTMRASALGGHQNRGPCQVLRSRNEREARGLADVTTRWQGIFHAAGIEGEIAPSRYLRGGVGKPPRIDKQLWVPDWAAVLYLQIRSYKWKADEDVVVLRALNKNEELRKAALVVLSLSGRRELKHYLEDVWKRLKNGTVRSRS